jgi:flagellar biosynthesis anti-sigma factor FlgM
MKIDVNSLAASQLPTDRGAKPISNSSPAIIPGASGDTTTFSTDTASVQSLTRQALNSPAIRQDKVDALKQSVNSGEYKLDATKITDAIIAGNHE